MKIIKLLFNLLLLAIALMCLLIVYANVKIEQSAKHKTFTNTEDIEANKVGLLLGTAKYLVGGGVNPYYQYRIDAAVKLFNSGKIDVVLVSGDNGSEDYDEPTTFKKELMAKGIPENKIVLDYAGFRTLDSVVRANKIFGQSKFTVISQQFHNERAIYIGKAHGLELIGFNAKDVEGKNGLKVQLREYLARTKAWIDILINKKPKFYGDPISIP